MDSLLFSHAFQLIKEFGLPGLILLIWWLDQKNQSRILTAYREDTQKALRNYKDDTNAQKVMYDNNIALVKQYNHLCGDLKEVVMLNAGQFQELNNNIVNNSFCPYNRVKKIAGVPE